MANSKPERPGEGNFGTVIGIDLGTTYSCVGYYSDNHVEIIENDQGNNITPSFVAFTEHGERLVGDAARDQLTINPENTVFNVKRLIGRKWDDLVVQDNIKNVPFKVFEKESKPYIRVRCGGKTLEFAPEQISAMVLERMKVLAEERLGQKVTHAVITIPAYFNDAQRQATKDAARIAGLKVLRLLNEPTAAAIEYWNGTKGKTGSAPTEPRKILVYDLGGGTLDVSLMEFKNDKFMVLATNGNTNLGGEDFDQNVIEDLLPIVEEECGYNISGNIKALMRLKLQVEKAKRVLSKQEQYSLVIDSLVSGKHFKHQLTRARFNILNNELFEKTLGPVKDVMKQTGVNEWDFGDGDDILLTGGSSRVVAIQQLTRAFFHTKDVGRRKNPDEAIARGAAFLGATYQHAENLLGIPKLSDVTPLSLGMSIKGDIMSTIITRNSSIPVKRSSEYVTVEDNQTVMTIEVKEGERPIASENEKIGQFTLTGLPKKPRGEAKVEVTFRIDEDGILIVTAHDPVNNNTKTVEFMNHGNHSPQEIQEMMRKAEQFRADDEQRKTVAKKLNEIDEFVYTLKKKVKAGTMDVFSEPIARSTIDAYTNWVQRNQDPSEDQCTALLEKLKILSK